MHTRRLTDAGKLRDALDSIRRSSAWAPLCELVDCLVCSHGHAAAVDFDWEEPRLEDVTAALDLLRAEDIYEPLMFLVFELWMLRRSNRLYGRDEEKVYGPEPLPSG
jgi:hypothetical protein